MWVIKFTNSVYLHVSSFRNMMETLHKYSCGAEFALKLKNVDNYRISFWLVPRFVKSNKRYLKMHCIVRECIKGKICKL